MTQNLFNHIKNNFSQYKGRMVEYTCFFPSAGKNVTRRGFLSEVGTDCNEGSFIISRGGWLQCVYHKNVRLMPHITLKKDGTISFQKNNIGTWKCTDLWKEEGSRRDKGGHLLVHHIWEAELNNGSEHFQYTRKELITSILNNIVYA